MATTVYTDWYDEVLPEFPGALQALVLNAIKQAAIEFCRRSLVWRVDQAEIAIVANTNAYAWTPPANTEVAQALKVWLNKYPIDPKTVAELSALYGDYMQATGAPEFFAADVPEQLILVPTPTSVPTVGITAKLAIKPTRAATGLDSFIFNRYYDGIAHGAKARMYRMPRKPWTDKQAAADYQGKFDAAVATATLDATRSYGGARTRSKPSFC